MRDVYDYPLLHDPDLDNSIVEVIQVQLPNRVGLCKGIGVDIDSGEIVEWVGNHRPMMRLRQERLNSPEDRVVHAIVNIMQERKRYTPTLKEEECE